MPFQLTPTLPLNLTCHGVSISFILRSNDDEINTQDVQIVKRSERVTQSLPVVPRPFEGITSREKIKQEDDEILR